MGRDARTGGVGMSEANRYPGICYRCGKEVAAGKGVFSYERSPGVRWSVARFQRNWPMVEHKACRERFAGTDVHYRYQPEGKNETSA